MQIMKYLWDRYDIDDETGDPLLNGENHWYTVQALNNFPISQNNRGANEARLSDPDGRSVIDFNANADFDYTSVLNMNCGGVGD